MSQIDIGKLKPVFKGAYNNSTAYVLDDIVYYNGSSYVAKSSTTGNIPTNGTYWEVVASGFGGIYDSTLSLGSASQQLRVNSGATALEFYTPTPATSDFVKIATGNFTNVSNLLIDGTSNWGTAGTYKSHMLTFAPLKITGGSYSRIRIRSVKNGVVETGNQYTYGGKVLNSSNGTIYGHHSESTSYIQLDYDYFRGSDNAHHSFDIHLHNMHGASDYDYLQVTGMTAHANQDGDQRLHGTTFHGMTHTNHAVNNGRTGIEFHSSHQNISGTWCTYGIK